APSAPAAPQAFAGLPGKYPLSDTTSGAAVQFTVSPTGLVTYSPDQEGILTGTGTPTLTVHGVTVTLDTRPLSVPRLVLDNVVVVSNAAPQAFAGLPGKY